MADSMVVDLRMTSSWPAAREGRYSRSGPQLPAAVMHAASVVTAKVRRCLRLSSMGITWFVVVSGRPVTLWIVGRVWTMVAL